MQALDAALTIIGGLMIVATVLPLVRSDYWIIRALDFPRLQITVVFVLIFVAWMYAREDHGAVGQVFLGLLALSLAYQLWRMWPYTPLHTRQVKRGDARDGRGLSVLISNVLMTNRDSERLRAQVRRLDPDLVVVVETDAWWEAELRELEAARPHVVKQPQDNTYGMLCFSRFPLVGARVRFLVQDDVPSIHARVRLPSGDEVNLRCLHPRPPAPGESERSTERDAELLVVAKELKGRDEPGIVLGDLNDVAWSRTTVLFQKISGMLDPRVGRGFYSTFNANWPFIRFPLDHAFLTRHFLLAEFQVLPHVGSDHFPVFARLTLSPTPRAESNQPPPAPAPSEEREADEKIERAK